MRKLRINPRTKAKHLVKMPDHHVVIHSETSPGPTSRYSKSNIKTLITGLIKLKLSCLDIMNIVTFGERGDGLALLA